MIRFCSAFAALFLSAIYLHADEPKPEKWLVDRALTVTASPTPVPIFKYRLYPKMTERKEGNAVPIYERLAHERPDAKKKELQEKSAAWKQMPLDKLPLVEIKTFLNDYQYNFRQLELGARRKTAEWNYTLDTGDLIGVRLPDMQEMRLQAAMLVVKARFEIAENRYADAIRTLETGFALSEQIGPNHFIICSLVGIACATQMTDCLLDLVERPDAPNLYWALTVLPRPLIDMRQPMETEMQLLESQWPIMADLDRPRTPEQWEAALAQVRPQFIYYGEDARREGPATGMKPSEPAAKSPDLPIAKKYLTEVVHLNGVEAMSPAQILLLYTSHYYHEIRDDVFKGSYLQFPQARPLDMLADERFRKSIHDTEAGRLVRSLLPAVLKVSLAQVRIERKLAALRAIEALKLYALKSGQWPDRLDQVTVVPLPIDPGTGQAFEYQREGQTAVLTSRIAGEPLESTGLRYRITIRK